MTDQTTDQTSSSSPQITPEIASDDLIFPIVGIGASAGGLKAFENFFQNLPSDSGMAFVLVQHLAPHHESELADLLQNYTLMQVRQVQDRTEIRPNCVYVIPPAKDLSIRDRILYLSEPTQERGHRAPIDLFFRSLAEDQGENAVCIILSGTGTDGSLGLKAIKERGGITMAQSTADADYDGMPNSAVRTSLVDIVGTASELAAKLVEYRQTAARIRLPVDEETLSEDGSDALVKIFAQLRDRTGHDFTHYKRSTILRRIGRRLQVNQIETIASYLTYLRHSPDEVYALFKDLLISVTNFFRDPVAFDALKDQVIPLLFLDKGPQDQVRVWVAGCATGEEAYSIAILLHEYVTQLDTPPDVQVFATDLDGQAVAHARDGLYDRSIVADVSLERLTRYFVEDEGGYRVRREIREMVLFAEHNLIADPPFSRLDLISCRNLLIYLNRDVQEKAFELFHYALSPDGFLFLGSSESANAMPQLFATLEKKHHLFRRQNSDGITPRFRIPLLDVESRAGFETSEELASQTRSLHDMYENWSLRHHTPPRLLVDSNHDIVYIFGGAGRFLLEEDGPATHNILQKIRGELRLDLRTALYQAFHKGERVVTRGLQLLIDEEIALIRMLVGHIDDDDFPREYVEIVFERLPLPEEPTLSTEQTDQVRTEIVNRLEEELLRTRERLQTTIEEHETSTEELKASNEELQSMNEELRSTTEELETSKEELQSMNEELVTVNQELKNKIDELSHTNSDLQNLMSSTEIGTIFLDHHLRIKRFTPKAQEIFNLINTDVGRPLVHISHKLAYDTLIADAAQVLETQQTIEQEVRCDPAHWYIVRLFPYQTIDQRIDGVVINFINVTKLKAVEEELRQRNRQQETVAELGHLALEGIALVHLMNTAAERICRTLDTDYCDAHRVTEESDFLLQAGYGWQEGLAGEALAANEQEGQLCYILTADEPVIIQELATDERFTPLPLFMDHQVVSGISIVIPGYQQPYGILGAYTKTPRSFTDDDVRFLQTVANLLADAVERTRAEEELRGINNTLEERVEERTVQVRSLIAELTLAEQSERRRISQILHDDVQQLLHSLQVRLLILSQDLETIATAEPQGIQENLAESSNLVQQALRSTRSLSVELSPPVLQDERLRLVLEWLAEHITEVHQLAITTDIRDDCYVASAELRSLLFRAVRELLFNIVKHAGVSEATLRAFVQDSHLVIQIEDHGVGFVEAEVTTQDQWKYGFGLYSTRERIGLFGGALVIDSKPGTGTSITILIPQKVTVP